MGRGIEILAAIIIAPMVIVVMGVVLIVLAIKGGLHKWDL
jgi:hypothetical protein